MFKKIIKAIQENQKKRAEYYLLSKMSDRELRDLGISKSQIREVIYGETAY